MSEETIEKSMSIILNAGDARAACKKALDAIAEFDIEKANENLKEAHDKIVLAHQTQTDVIQSAMQSETDDEYTMLFAHAQDTVMTIYSEINIAKQLVKITESLDKRFRKLENNLEK